MMQLTMVEWMPPLLTDRGKLKYFSVNEVRLDAGAQPVVVDYRQRRFAVEDDGTVREACDGEVTAFLARILNAPQSQVERSGASHTSASPPDCPTDSQSSAHTPR